METTAGRSAITSDIQDIGELLELPRDERCQSGRAEHACVRHELCNMAAIEPWGVTKVDSGVTHLVTRGSRILFPESPQAG